MTNPDDQSVDSVRHSLDEIREQAGLYKNERVSSLRRNVRIGLSPTGEVLNMCANNYLGLADHPDVIAAAHDALERWGYGLASVRFICGTQSYPQATRIKNL